MDNSLEVVGQCPTCGYPAIRVACMPERPDLRHVYCVNKLCGNHYDRSLYAAATLPAWVLHAR